MTDDYWGDWYMNVKRKKWQKKRINIPVEELINSFEWDVSKKKWK